MDRPRSPDESPKGDAAPLNEQVVGIPLRDASDFIQRLQYGARLGTTGLDLSFSGNNLLPNGGFEDGNTGWTDATWGAGSVSSANFTEGRQAYFNTLGGFGVGTIESDPVPIDPAAVFALKLSADALVVRTGGANSITAAGLTIEFYDSTDTLVGADTIANEILRSGTWQTVVGEMLVPQGVDVQYCKVTVGIFNNLINNHDAYIDDVILSVCPIIEGMIRSGPEGSRSVRLENGLIWFGVGHPEFQEGLMAGSVSYQSNTELADGGSLTIQPPYRTGADPVTIPYIILRTNDNIEDAQITLGDGPLYVDSGFLGQNSNNVLLDASYTPTTTYATIGGVQTIYASPPGVFLGVTVVVSTHIETLAANQIARLRASISLDGGSTYDVGLAQIGMAGSGAGGNLFLPLTAHHGFRGTPSGDIKVKVEGRIDAGAGASFPFVNVTMTFTTLVIKV